MTAKPKHGTLELKTDWELTKLTAEGWQLHGTALCAGQEQTEYTSDGRYVQTRPLVTMFILEAPQDDRLKVLTEERDDARMRLGDAESELEKAHAEWRDLNSSSISERADLNTRLNFARERGSKAEKEEDAAVKRMQKLEGDLAKVRSAIGDLKWKEILDG